MDLKTAATILYRRFGSAVRDAYVPGKTQFRDSLVRDDGVSVEEAETICDSLERSQVIHFTQSEIDGNVWTIEPPEP